MQAVEGMDRPLLVLDADWRLRYINPAGAAVLHRTVESLVGRDLWDEFPEAVGGPFEALYRQVRETGRSGGTEAWFAPLGKWFRADAFPTLRRAGGHLRRRDAAGAARRTSAPPPSRLARSPPKQPPWPRRRAAT